MTRALRASFSGFVVLTLVLLGSVAHAGPKQKLAVLGIEAVIGANGQIDPADVTFAKDLTKALRSRVNNSTMYDLTKDERELSDEKLMNNCQSEAPACMAPIGQGMNADVLLFGKVENAKGGYKVTLKLVSVGKKQQIASDPNAWIATADTKGVGLANWVREHYRKLTGESANGTLIVSVIGATSGNVLVDGQPKETLKSGQATLSLPEGAYRIGIDADGFPLFEERVTISADKPTELRPDLKQKKDPDTGTGTGPSGTGTTGGDSLIGPKDVVSTKSSKTPWKIAAGIGLGGAAVGTGVLIWQYSKIRAYKNHDIPAGVQWQDDGSATPRDTGSVGDGDCGNGRFVGMNPGGTQSKFDDACSARSTMKWLVPVTAGLAAIGAGALIYVMVSKDGTEERPAGVTGRRVKRKNFVVTPVVTPDGTGATLRFDW
jgi:hypothetical protein